MAGMRRDHVTLTGSLLALVAASLFATLGPLTRFAADIGLGSVALVAWRAGIGAITLAVAIAVGGGAAASLGALRGLDRRGRVSLALAVTMGFTLNIAMFVAFGLIAIALALMLFYTYPAMVAAVAVLTGRERLTGWRAAALALASSGAVLVLLGGLVPSGGIEIDPIGVLLALGAAASQTVFITISRHGYRGVPAETATMVILLGSAVGAVLVAIAAGLAAQLLVPLERLQPWPIVLVAGILGAALPSFLFLTAIRRIGGTRTGILMLWEPVVGVVLAALLLGERLVPVQIAGGALVLGAALLLQLASDPAEEPIAGALDIV
jgi:drug/metabolite transporter (DMT)-like permease